MKKHKFKKMLKQKLYEKASNFLYKLKEKHSKTEKLNTYGLQNYLVSQDLSIREKKLLFSLRTRMFHVKTNYKKKYEFNMQCSLCDDNPESESEKHLLKCTKILSNLSDPIEVQNANYEDIFSSNLEDQVKITQIFTKVVKSRQILSSK